MVCNGRVIWIVLLLIVPVLVGCFKAADEKAREKNAARDTGVKVDVDLSEGKVRIQDSQGKLTTATAGEPQIPDDFPKDIMIYPAVRVLEAIAAEEQGMFFLRLESEEAREKIADAYKEEMKALGWKQTAASATDGTVVLIFAKGKRSVTAGVSRKENGKTGIEIEVAVRK